MKITHILSGPSTERTKGETQMIGWGLDTISKELIWALVVVAVIVAVAVVSLLRK